jgi:hypothetical protein
MRSADMAWLVQPRNGYDLERLALARPFGIHVMQALSIETQGQITTPQPAAVLISYCDLLR